MRWLDNLFDTLFRLQAQTYLPTTLRCFVTLKPKAREIHAAYFGDRIVHHWLVSRLTQLFEPIFIYDLYSNRLDKGTHFAVKRLQYFMRSHQSVGYFLQLDIHNFFNSIDRPLLFAILQKRLRKSFRQNKINQAEFEALRWLAHIFLKQDIVANTQYCGLSAKHNQVPSHKKLGALGTYKGLPIGNLTSQFFANAYLNELDQFIKHELKCTYYLRYVDDFVILHHDSTQLKKWLAQIEFF